MIERIRRIAILGLAVWIGMAGSLPASAGADVPAASAFEQGVGYEAGAYDRGAVQPAAFNWTRQSRFAASPYYDKKWAFATGGQVRSSPAIGADGTIYVGSDDGCLYALNPDGSLRWKFATGVGEEYSPWIYSSPAIGADGTVYVGSSDKNVYAVNPDGSLKWAFQTKRAVQSSPAIGADGTVYAGSDGGTLYAIDSAGREKWKFETDDAFFAMIQSSPVIGADGTIYIGSFDGYFYAFDPEQDPDNVTPKWSFDNSGWSIKASPAIGADGTVYMASDSGILYAFDPDPNAAKRVKWSLEVGANETSFVNALKASPVIGADGTIYVVDIAGRLFALDPDQESNDAKIKWSYDTGWVVYGSPIIDANGIVIFGSHDRHLYAIDSEGRLKWAFKAGKEVTASPAIGPDGTIYVGSWDKKLYAIGINPPDIPLNVQAAPEDGKVSLSWDAAAGAAGYRIYMYEGASATDEAERWTLVNAEPVAGNAYIVDELTAGRLYRFAVEGIGAGGSVGGMSASVSATPYTVIAEIDPIEPIRVAEGIEADELPLPQEVRVRLTDGSSLNVAVDWHQGSVGYDPAMAGTYPFAGELRLPDHIRQPHSALIAECSVTVLTGANALLSAIRLNGTPLPGFQPGIFSYAIQVPYATDSLQIAAETNAPGIVFEVVGGDEQRLQAGMNRIVIVVGAEGAAERSEYTINVEREAPAAKPTWSYGSVLALSNMTQTSVMLRWPGAVDDTGVEGYRVFVNGGKQAEGAAGDFAYSVTDSVYSYTVTGLAPGTYYRFAVTAYDAENNESESGLSAAATTLSVSTGGGSPSGGSAGGSLSGNANLKLLEILAGGKALLLKPEFAPHIMSYRAETEAAQVELKVAADHALAKATWQGQSLEDGVKIDLREGENVLELVVQAADGTKRTYTLTILRRSPDGGKPAVELNDIAGHWAESDVKKAVAAGFIGGYPDGSFKPNRATTRAEFAVMLMLALRWQGEGEDELRFADRERIGEWARAAISLAAQSGIIAGYTDGTFRPNAQVTRAEMAAMIARALGLSADKGEAATGFADDAVIPIWARGSVEAIRRLGIAEGFSGNLFAPAKPATRAEAAIMLLRMLERQSR